MIPQLEREQALLQMMFKRNEEHIKIFQEKEMLQSIVEAKDVEIADLKTKILPPVE